MNKEETLFIMDELKKCKPQVFLEKISENERGTHFVLGHLIHAKGEEVISSDLSNALSVSTARMAKLLTNMEKKGLIIKRDSPKDARKTVVELTDKGRRIGEMYKETIINFTTDLIEKVGYEDMKEFIRISYRIKEAIPFDGSVIKKFREIDEQK